MLAAAPRRPNLISCNQPGPDGGLSANAGWQGRLNPSSLERDRSGRETLQSIGAKGPGNLPSPAKACGLFVLYSLQGMEFVRFMKRRHFINGLGATLVWPSACAIAATRTAKLGFLGFEPASAWAGELEALRAGLRELGYVENQNYIFEFEWADSVDQMPVLADQLVRSHVDIIIAPASTQVEPAKRATTTLPIVFAQHADPVGSGHVKSLAHPGGNITGVSMVLRELAAKGLEILTQALPAGHRIAVLWNPTTPSHVLVNQELERASKSLSIELVMISIRAIEDFEGAFDSMTREQVDGFLVPSSPLTNARPEALAELALKHKIPGMFANKDNVRAGGLMSYGADFNYMYRHAATYIDKILRGAKPADLPVEQASKYYLVVNLKTAREIGFQIPATLLARADEVID